MRRIAVVLGSLAAAIAVVVSVGAGGNGDPYEVRAAFDSGGFLVPGEEVRIAGARVGTVTDLEVSGPETSVHEDGAPDPGKAIVVLRIDDPGFQDFRADASCLIRPQSLIGEKFVECRPTRPRAPGAALPPPLEEIPEGEPGAGQRFLALERNGKAVDLDLINNIMEEPYPDRFRLILNDLGAGLAARGEDLAEIVERANPALRETNEVLAILARQNRRLANLASDGDAILGALAREREHVASFVNEATVAGEATAERRTELEAGLQKLPGFLRELRSTMTELGAFADTATPVFGDLGEAAPSLTRASRALGPFADAGTRAFATLGDAAERSGPPLRGSDPVIRQIRGLARSGKPATRNLAQMLATLRRTGGFEHLLKTIFGLGGTVNAFDSYGHLVRALIPLNNCFDYRSIPQPGCDANFHRPGASAASASQPAKRTARGADSEIARALDAGGDGARRESGQSEGQRWSERDAELLLDFLLGEPEGGDVEGPPPAGSEEGR